MKTYLKLIVIPLLFLGCSSTEEITHDNNNTANISETDSVALKQKAIGHFVDGTVAETNGDYTGAILEFTEALRYDNSSGIYYELARNHLAINKLAEALKYAKLAVNNDSTNADYLDLMSDIYLKANAVDSAAIALEKIIEHDSTSIETYYKLARIYEDSKPLKAINIYEKLTKIIGPDWNVLIRVAELYEKLGYKEEASQSLEELLAIDPSNIALQKLIIDFYQRNNKFDEAMKMLNDIIELTPDDLDARQKKAQIFIQQNDWDSAAKEYKYIMLQPNVPMDLKVGIGATYFNKALSDSSVFPAAKDLFLSIDKDTTYWEVKLYLGAIAISEGKDSLAINYFKYVTENARWNTDAWIRLGGLYFDNRKYEEAEKIMREAIELFPYDFTVNLILGLSLGQQSKNAEAKDYLKKAVDLNTSDVNALSAYGFTLSQLGENEEAVQYLRRALIIDPQNVNLLGQLGLIYNNMDMMAESDSIYEKALEVDSTNALVNNNYAYSLSERGLQLERALRMVKLAVKADSLNSSYLDTIGWVYFKLSKFDEAHYYIKKAIDQGGENNAVLLEHLGDVMFMQGEKDQAMQLWEKALKLDSSNEVLKQKVETGAI